MYQLYYYPGNASLTPALDEQVVAGDARTTLTTEAPELTRGTGSTDRRSATVALLEQQALSLGAGARAPVAHEPTQLPQVVVAQGQVGVEAAMVTGPSGGCR